LPLFFRHGLGVESARLASDEKLELILMMKLTMLSMDLKVGREDES